MSWHGFEIARAAYGLAIIFGVAFLLGGVSWAFNAFMDWIAFRIIARHDGNHSAGACPLTKGGTRTETPASTLTTVGGPFAVDASNGPTQEVWNKDHTFGIRWLKSYDIKMDPDEVARIEAQFHAAEERRRLTGLTEIYRVNRLDPVVPPPSRSIRRSIH